jgi:hypothetical protein
MIGSDFLESCGYQMTNRPFASDANYPDLWDDLRSPLNDIMYNELAFEVDKEMRSYLYG